MPGLLPLALLITLLLMGALALAFAAARQGLGRARIHVRAHALGATAAGGRAGRQSRATDPLLLHGGGELEGWLRSRWSGAAALQARLDAAGITTPMPKLLMMMGGGGLCLALVLLMLGANPAVALLLGIALGWSAFSVALALARRRRRAQSLQQLPDALGLMVRGLRAGVPVTETIAEVAQEVPAPLGLMFRRAHDQVRIGQPLEKALAEETSDLALAPMNFLIVTLSVQRETGGNLAETLAKLDDILRRREQMEMKVKAMSSEARASALIIGALPIVMGLLMWLVAPDYVLPLFTTTAGLVLLGGALASLLAGGWLMAQLVQFEI